MKTMLITGATSGIGESLARYSAQSGYRVIACGRNQEKLSQLTQSPNVEACRFDASVLDECSSALESVTTDIVVLNAGVCEYVDVNDFDPEMFRRVFDANVMGVVNVVSVLLPKLTSGAQIVMVDSLARLLPFTKSEAYGASKAALYYLAKSLSVDLLERDILVQTVSPGFVKTPLTDKNDFSMPMRISSEKAAQIMLKGIERRKQTIHFPWLFSFFLHMLSALPSRVQISLCHKMKV